MPIYDYRCPACKAVFEQRAGYEDAERPCACGATASRQAIYRQGAKVHEGVTSWNAQTADGKYRVTDFMEARQESHYWRTRG